VSAALPPRVPVAHRDRRQPRALATGERQAILAMLHGDRFADLAPAEIWAILLDEGTYLGSVSTFYRLLRAAGESRERRAQATHPAAVKPELAAAAPNQVWSWDITKLHGPAKWTYYHLYVLIDIYSRYAVGWMVATRESAVLAEKLIAGTCAKQDIARGQLAIHADRGSSMTSKREAGHRPRPAGHPRGPRLLDDLEAGRAAARRSRRHPVPLPAPCEQRQPVLRSAVQDPEIPARLPCEVRLYRRRPGALPGLLPLV